MAQVVIPAKLVCPVHPTSLIQSKSVPSSGSASQGRPFSLGFLNAMGGDDTFMAIYTYPAASCSLTAARPTDPAVSYYIDPLGVVVLATTADEDILVTSNPVPGLEPIDSIDLWTTMRVKSAVAKAIVEVVAVLH